MDEVIAEIKEASKVYKIGDTQTVALAKSSLAFKTNELTIILGPSGSGKTTLLSLLGCVIYPSSGQVIVNGTDVTGFSQKKLAVIRLNNIGFVFQGFNLIQPLTALENVMAPLLLKGFSRRLATEKSKAALAQVDMADRMNHLPKMLSGGQKQRTAIARALVTDPPVLLCDEPTASIDSKNAHKIMVELKDLSRAGKSVLIVTHDTRLCKYADRIIYLSEGQTSETPFKEDEYEL